MGYIINTKAIKPQSIEVNTMFHPSEIKAMKAAKNKRIKFYFNTESDSTVPPSKAKPKIVEGSFRGSYAVILGDGTRINCANYSTAQYYVRVHSN